MATLNPDTFAEFFSITRKVVRTAPRYLVTFPCGQTWQIDRNDWSFPVFVDGEQTGVECCPDTLRDAVSDAASYGATVARIKAEAA